MAGEERNLIPKVQIKDVKKIYEGRNGQTIALNGANLDIYDNEFICVVGPSGCGKSTLLNIIAGLHEATSGEVLVDGVKVEGTGVDRGVVFQQYALFPWLTVKKNVMFGLNLKKGLTDAEREEIALKYIKMVGLEKFVAYLRGFFDQKGMHVQYNVISRETLLDAQAHPENYKTLVVRVAGYSALFTTLSRSLQDDIISRTEQGF